MPAAIPAIIAGVAAVGGALISANSNKKAVEAQTNAANNANLTQAQQYAQTRADQAPWRQTGVDALARLNSGMAQGGSLNTPFSMANFQQDPGYAFRLQQGQQALERSGAARGMTLSGAQSKALIGYGQGMGSQEYQNAYNRYNNDQTTQYNRLASMAGLGQQANQMNQQAGMNMANNVSNTQAGLGNALGAGAIAQGNNMAGALNGFSNNWQQQNMWNSMMAQRQSNPNNWGSMDWNFNPRGGSLYGSANGGTEYIQ